MVDWWLVQLLWGDAHRDLARLLKVVMFVMGHVRDGLVLCEMSTRLMTGNSSIYEAMELGVNLRDVLHDVSNPTAMHALYMAENSMDIDSLTKQILRKQATKKAGNCVRKIKCHK